MVDKAALDKLERQRMILAAHERQAEELTRHAFEYERQANALFRKAAKAHRAAGISRSCAEERRREIAALEEELFSRA